MTDIRRYWIVLAVLFLPAMCLAQINISQGLVGYWNFDQGSGSVAVDSSGNGNNGTIYGATLVTGVSGYALSFDGLNDYIDCGVHSTLDLRDDLTVSVWYQRPEGSDSFSVDWHYFGVMTGPQMNYFKFEFGLWGETVSFKPWSSNDIGFGVGDSHPLARGLWHNMTGIRHNNVISLFVDGQLTSSRSDFTGPLGAASHLYLGGPLWQRYLRGIIDEVRIYNRALNETEIQYLYQHPGGGNDPVVADVLAVQVAQPSEIVRIAYDLTHPNLLPCTVALQVSSDGGSTWAVPVMHTQGDIGSNITPGSRTIYWNAGQDWPNHRNSNMKVRVIANDQ